LTGEKAEIPELFSIKGAAHCVKVTIPVWPDCDACMASLAGQKQILKVILKIILFQHAWLTV
jgi:hypothetical protein